MSARIALIGLLALTLTIPTRAGSASTPTTVPDNLTVPPAAKMLSRISATGSQIYACAMRANDPSTSEWVLKAPDAELWAEGGEKVGRHYAGPTWEANDGSRVVGEAIERAGAPEPGAIPWLLLKARATEGAGFFSAVTFIQRLDTIGGVAPTDGCDRSTVGTERAVEYRATYIFYTASPSHAE